MANKITGKVGRLYYSSAFIRADTISFVAGDLEIEDSANGFITAGFAQGNKIDIIGSTLNDGGKTIATGGVAAGALTITVAPVTELAGNRITIIKVPPDTLWSGFFNWTLNWETGITEVTDFDDVSAIVDAKKYIPTIKDWTATAEAYWVSGTDRTALLGTQMYVRFFQKYVAIPSAQTPALYYEGACRFVSIGHNTPVETVINEPITFQGDGTLRSVTRTTAWTT